MIQKFRHHWNTFWFRSGPPHAIAFLRIALGGFLLLLWILRLPHTDLILSHEGIVLPLIDPLHAGLFGSLFTPLPEWTSWLVMIAIGAALFCFTIGCFTRVSGGIAFVLLIYTWFISLHTFNTSFDRLFLFMLLILSMSGCDELWSLDAFRKRGSWNRWIPVSILPQRLIAVQITAVYLGVGMQKLIIPDWQSGEILAQGFIGHWATDLSMWLFLLNIPLWFYDIAVFLIKCLEIGLPFGLWKRKFRWLSIAAGSLFHTMIALLMGIWWFLALIPSYIVFFSPEEVQSAFEHRKSSSSS